MNQKLELDTLEQGVIIEVIYAVGFVVIGFLINRIGKFLILCKLNTLKLKTFFFIKKSSV